MQKGILTWNGMPNVIWSVNREKSLVMGFATQLLPVDGKKTVDLEAWDRFGSL